MQWSGCAQRKVWLTMVHLYGWDKVAREQGWRGCERHVHRRQYTCGAHRGSGRRRARPVACLTAEGQRCWWWSRATLSPRRAASVKNSGGLPCARHCPRCLHPVTHSVPTSWVGDCYWSTLQMRKRSLITHTRLQRRWLSEGANSGSLVPCSSPLIYTRSQMNVFGGCTDSNRKINFKWVVI